MISWLAVMLLIAVALADSVASGERSTLRVAGPVVAAGAALTAFLLGASPIGIVVATAGVTVAALAWRLSAGKERGPWWLAVALGSGVAVHVIGAGIDVGPERWPGAATSAFAGTSALSVLTVVGVLGVMSVTGNVVVRMVVGWIGGVPGSTSSRLVRSGRVIGILERVIIVILLSAGWAGAVAGVLAVKGIVRFPQIRSSLVRGGDEPVHDGDVSEYVLVGTLASVLWALVGAAALG